MSEASRPAIEYETFQVETSGCPNTKPWRANWFSLNEFFRSLNLTFFYRCTIVRSLLPAY